MQKTNWKLRPLTAGMMHYARADTHSLLYIYDCLRVSNESQMVPQTHT